MRLTANPMKTIVVTDENGVDTVYEIVLTFESPDNGKNYVKGEGYSIDQ